MEEDAKISEEKRIRKEKEKIRENIKNVLIIK